MVRFRFGHRCAQYSGRWIVGCLQTCFLFGPAGRQHLLARFGCRSCVHFVVRNLTGFGAGGRSCSRARFGRKLNRVAAAVFALARDVAVPLARNIAVALACVVAAALALALVVAVFPAPVRVVVAAPARNAFVAPVYVVAAALSLALVVAVFPAPVRVVVAAPARNAVVAPARVGCVGRGFRGSCRIRLWCPG